MAAIYAPDNQLSAWRPMQVIQVRPKTINLLARIMKPFVEEGIIAQPEANQIIATLKANLKGENWNEIAPKFLTQQEVAEMLGIAFSNFRKLEAQGVFPFHRRQIGNGSIRYLNREIIQYLLATE